MSNLIILTHLHLTYVVKYKYISISLLFNAPAMCASMILALILNKREH